MSGWLRALRRPRAAEAQAPVLHEAWATLFAASSHGAFVADVRGRIIHANPALAFITGHEAGVLIGATPALWMARTALPETASLWAALARGQPWRGRLEGRRGDGLPFWCALELLPVRAAGGRVTAYAGSLEDLGAQRAAEAEIRRLTHVDTLTGIPNRRQLLDALGPLMKSAHPGALLRLDLRDFVRINDRFGEAEGDRLLCAVAAGLGACLRGGDMLARLGGDSFAVLMPHTHCVVEAQAQAGRLAGAVEAAHARGSAPSPMSCWMGLAMFPGHGRDAAEVVRNAGIALQWARQRREAGCVVFGAQVERDWLDARALERELPRALERGEFRLEYQPKVHTGSGRVVGAEALLRWHHPRLGEVSSARFIPVAEASRLILPIGRWAMEEVCRQLRVWEAQGLPPVPVAVNVSAVQFGAPGLFDAITGILARAGILPGQIELEVTESLLMDNPDAAAAVLHRLRAAGFSIAIDDFGTGFSSLAYLKKLPLAVLKIDRAFVKGLPEDPDDRAIVEAIVGMADHLLLDVVVEGVETAEQVVLLQSLGCQYFQGYHFSRPLAPAPFADFLRGRLAAAGGRAAG